MRHFLLGLVTLAVLSGLLPEGAIASTIPGADPTHPRITQEAGSQVATAKAGVLQPFQPAGPMPAVGGAGGPVREVYGFALL